MVFSNCSACNFLTLTHAGSSSIGAAATEQRFIFGSRASWGVDGIEGWKGGGYVVVILAG